MSEFGFEVGMRTNMKFGFNRKTLGGFVPSDISGLDFWGRFDLSSTVTVDGANYVQSFQDQSPNLVTYSQGTASAQPLYQNQNSFYFDGADFIPMDSLLTYISTNTKGTICLWVKMTDATPAALTGLFTFGDTNANERITFDVTTSGLLRAGVSRLNVLRWFLQTDVAFTSNNTWAHVALVQNAVNPVLYVNGVAVAQTFTTSTDKTFWLSKTPGIDNVRLGCMNLNSSGNSGFLTGSLAEPLYYNTNLTSAQILQIYNAKRGIYA